jgi:hypothetical protein
MPAARAMCGVSTSTAASLSCALSAKWARMRRVVSIGSADGKLERQGQKIREPGMNTRRLALPKREL